MNKIFKTVWNRHRRAYVAVNEATTASSQAQGGTSVGAVSVGNPNAVSALIKPCAATLLALAVAGTAQAASSGSDIVLNKNFDMSASTVGWTSVTVNPGVTLTHNKEIDEDGAHFELKEATISGSITNNGIITGDGDLKTGQLTSGENSEFTQNKITITGSTTGPGIDNKGSINVVEADVKGDVKNDGSLVITGPTKITGNIDGSGDMTTGQITIGKDQTVNQGNLTFTGDTTISGTVTTEKNLTVGGGEGKGTTTTVDKDATLNVGNDLIVLAKENLTNNGTINANKGKIWGVYNGNSVTNLKDTFDLYAGGTVAGAGTLTVDKAFTQEAGSTFQQGTVTTKDLATIGGTFNVTTHFDAQKGATFTDDSTGAVGKLTQGADVSHSGSMTLTEVAGNNHNLTNTKGTLTIGTASGVASGSNAAGATLNVTGSYAGADFSNAGTGTMKDLALTGTLQNTDGTLTLTGTNSAANTSISGGSADLGSFSNAGAINIGANGTVKGAVTTASGTNDGTFDGTSLTVSKTFTNNNTLSVSGFGDLTNYIQGATGSIKGPDLTFRGTSSELNGTVTATNNLTFAENAKYSGSAAVNNTTGTTTISSGSQIKVGNVDLGTTSLQGFLETTGGNISNITNAQGGVLTNTGALTLGTLTNASGITYNQNAKGASLAVTDGTIFTDSTININGGTLGTNDKRLESLGTGNTYTVGSLTASGNIGDAGWLDDRSVIYVKNLTSDSSVTVNAGGVLNAGTLAFANNAQQTVTINQGGAFETTLGNVFANVSGTTALDLDALSPADKVEIQGLDSSVVGSVGSLQNNVIAALGISGSQGDLVFADKALTIDAQTNVLSKLSDANFQGSVHFLGTTAEQGKASMFTVTKANEIADANANVRALFDGSSLHAIYDASSAQDQNLTLTVGDGTSDASNLVINRDIGFAEVLHTNQVVVKDGREFALAGRDDGKFSYLVRQNDSDQTGAVSVEGTGSKFTIGTFGHLNESGSLSAVTASNGGTLLGKAGSFKIGTVNVESASVQTMTGNKLAVNELTLDANSTLANAGMLTVETFSDAAGTAVTNTGVLTLTSNEATLLGSFTNGSVAAGSGADAANGTFTANQAVKLAGTFTNTSASAAVFKEALTIESGTLKNEAQGTDSGVQVKSLTVKTDDGVVNHGTFISQGDNVFSGGTSTETGRPANGHYAFLNKSGAVANLQNGTTTMGAEATNDGSLSSTWVVVRNDGTMNLGDVNVNDNALLRTYQSDAVTNVAGTLTVAGLGGLANLGTINAQAVLNQGQYLNNGGTLNIVSGGSTFRLNRLARAIAEVTYSNDGASWDTDVPNLGYFKSSNSKLPLYNLLSQTGWGNLNLNGNGLQIAVYENAKTSIFNTYDATGDGSKGRYFINGETAVFRNTDEGQVNVASLLQLTKGALFSQSGEKTATYAKNLALALGGRFEQAGGTVEAQSLVLDATTKSPNGVEWTGDKSYYTLSDGAASFGSIDLQQGTSFTVTGGTLSAGAVKLNGTMTFVGADKQLTGQSLTVDGALNGSLAVDNAVLTLGVKNGEALSSIENMPAYEGSVLALSAVPVIFGDAGKLAVGNGAVAKLTDLTNGSLWMGDDAVLGINTSKMTSLGENGTTGKGSTIFKGNGTSGGVSLAAGTKLYIDHAAPGKFYVSANFKDAAAAEEWLKNPLVEVGKDSGLDASKITFEIDAQGNLVMTNANGGTVNPDPDKPGTDPDQPGTGDVVGVIAGAAIPNTIDRLVNSPDIRDTNDTGVVGFLSKAVDTTFLDKGLQKETVNAVAQIGAAGGVLANANTLAVNIIDSVEEHLGEGADSVRNPGTKLWAKGLGNYTKLSLDYTGGETKAKGWNSGILFGGDYAFASNPDLRIGAAFGYQNGNLKDSGVVTTKNDFDGWSAMLYGGYTAGNWTVLGSLGYSQISSDVTQTLPSTMVLGEHKLSTDTDVVTASVKAEFRHPLAKSINVVPHVGLRMISASGDDAASKMGGKDAFSYKNDDQVLFELPVGVSVEANTATTSGWKVRGLADLTVAPAFGDTSVDSTVRAVGIDASDVVSADIAEKFTTGVKFGVQAQKDNWSFGANLGYKTGDLSGGTVAVGVNARINF